MDYKYIEQLIERYWNCETNTDEEEILRIFFRQEEIPEHLLRYKGVFKYIEHQRHIKLGNDFDERVIEKIQAVPVRAVRLAPRLRFVPYLKAAVIIALLFSVGGIVNQSMQTDKSPIVYVYDQFDNHNSDPQVAEADTAKVPLTSSVTCGTSQVERLK